MKQGTRRWPWFFPTLENDFHLLDGRERIQDATHHPDAGEVFLAEEQFLFARAGSLQVNGREQSFVAQATVKMDFGVTRAL